MKASTMSRLPPASAALTALALLSNACDGPAVVETAPKQNEPVEAAEAAARDVCGLLTQREVERFVGYPLGPGGTQRPGGGMSLCAWPAERFPSFTLMVAPAPPGGLRGYASSKTAGYRVLDLAGMSGAATVTIQEADPEYELREGVAFLVVQAGDLTVSVSPVQVEVQANTPKFDALKRLAEIAISRL